MSKLFINLDENQELYIFKLWEYSFEIWDIPEKIKEKIITDLDTFLFSNKKNTIEKWKEIIVEILKIRHKKVDITNLWEEHIKKIIDVIIKKIKK